MPRPSFPTTVQQFTAFFSSEEAYESYFECCRWPDAFVCIRCVSIDGWRIIRVVPTEHASFVKVRGIVFRVDLQCRLRRPPRPMSYL